MSGGRLPQRVYECEDGAHIERRVPALPPSRDRQRLDALQRSPAVYRMVFGQSRQDDLFAFLLRREPEERLRAPLDEVRVDLSPARTARRPGAGSSAQ